MKARVIIRSQTVPSATTEAKTATIVPITFTPTGTTRPRPTEIPTRIPPTPTSISRPIPSPNVWATVQSLENEYIVAPFPTLNPTEIAKGQPVSNVSCAVAMRNLYQPTNMLSTACDNLVRLLTTPVAALAIEPLQFSQLTRHTFVNYRIDYPSNWIFYQTSTYDQFSYTKADKTGIFVNISTEKVNPTITLKEFAANVDTIFVNQARREGNAPPTISPLDEKIAGKSAYLIGYMNPYGYAATIVFVDKSLGWQLRWLNQFSSDNRPTTQIEADLIAKQTKQDMLRFFSTMTLN